MRPIGLMSYRSVTNREPQMVNWDCESLTSASIHDVEAGGAKRLYRLCELLVAHQDVIGIKGTDRQDTDTGMSQRDRYRNENTDQIEVERTLNLDGSPAPTSPHLVAHLGIRANDRQLIRGSRHGEKAGTGCPLR